jgi:hypothetical protein
MAGNTWLASITANKGNSTVVAISPEVTVPGTWAPGTKVNVLFRVTGTSPTTTQLKVWPDGAPEPTTWLRSATDSFAGLQAPGAVGIRTYLSGSATVFPITANFYAFQVTP